VPQERSRSIQYINKLRILSIYAVVTAHVTIWLTMGSSPFTFNWWLGASIFYACFCSIPVFVMISGALLLDDSRGEPLREFYKKRLYRVGVPLVSWTIVYLGVRGFVDHERLTAARVFELIITADPYYHLWFLYMILGLYLVTPPLRTFVRHSTRTERLVVIVAMLVLANAYFQADALLWNNQRSIFTLFIPYIAFYLLGYEISRIDPRTIPSKHLILPVLICAIYLAAFVGPFIDRQGGIGPGQRFVFDFFTPPIIFMSIAIFWAARLHDATAKPVNGLRKVAVEWIASTTLGVYVLHPLVLTWIQSGLKSHAGNGTFLAGVLIVPLITFAACYLITSILMNIPLLRRTVC
jgi:surface polysaccharide O-acyltransferase-like enzyme